MSKIIIVILVIVNFLLGFITINLNLISKRKDSELDLLNDRNYDGLYRFMSYSHKFSNISINNEIKIMNRHGRYFSLDDIIHTQGASLIFIINNLDCDICVEEEIRILKNYIVPIHNIMFLVVDGDQKDIEIFRNSFRIDYDIFSIKKNDVSTYFNGMNFPFIFYLDHSLNVKSVHVPNKNFPEISHIYYEFIAHYFSRPN